MNKMIEKITDNAHNYEDFQNLGLLQFGRMYFPERITNQYAFMHYEMSIIIFQLLSPYTEFSFERMRYILVHREAAKSTFMSFLLPMYLIYLKGYNIYVRKSMLTWNPKKNSIKQHMDNCKKEKKDEIVEIKIDEKFILIASEVSQRAERFVNSIKTTIEKRGDLAKIFGEKSPKVIDVDEDRQKTVRQTWKTQAIVTADETFVFGLGAGQAIRGINEAGSRPTIAIIDDMYSKKNTITDTMRARMGYWFHSELTNSLDSRKGKLLWVGTRVNEDTVIKDFESDPDILGLDIPIISIDELKDAVKRFTKNGIVNHSKDQIKHLEGKYDTLSWKDRHPLYSILKRYEKHILRHELNYYYQEYMNRTVAPENQEIGPDSFLQLNSLSIKKDRINDKDTNWIEFTKDGYKWVGELILYAGVDPASSDNAKSDDTVIVVAGMTRVFPFVQGNTYSALPDKLKKGKIFPVIAHIEGGKYAIRDYKDMPGIANKLAYLSEIFNLSSIRIETMGQQEQIAREIRNYFNENDISQPVWNETSHTNKVERISSILKSIVNRFNHFICIKDKKINLLYNQLAYLGITDHDDYPDALSIAMKTYDIPMLVPESLQRYNEVSSSSLSVSRSLATEAKKIFGEDWWLYI